MKGSADLRTCLCGHPELSHTRWKCRRKDCECRGGFTPLPEMDGWHDPRDLAERSPDHSTP